MGSRDFAPPRLRFCVFLQRLQVLDQIALFVIGEPELEQTLVVREHVLQRREAAVTFVTTALSCAAYNWAAARFGGIKVRLV